MNMSELIEDLRIVVDELEQRGGIYSVDKGFDVLDRLENFIQASNQFEIMPVEPTHKLLKVGTYAPITAVIIDNFSYYESMVLKCQYKEMVNHISQGNLK